MNRFIKDLATKHKNSTPVESKQSHPIKSMDLKGKTTEELHDMILELLSTVDESQYKNSRGAIRTMGDMLIDDDIRSQISNIIGAAIISKPKSGSKSIREIVKSKSVNYSRTLPPSLDKGDLIGEGESIAYRIFPRWNKDVGSISTFINPYVNHAFNESIRKANQLTGIDAKLMSKYLTLVSIAAKAEVSDPTLFIRYEDNRFKSFTDNLIRDKLLSPINYDKLVSLRTHLNDNPDDKVKLDHALRTNSTHEIHLDSNQSDESEDSNHSKVSGSKSDGAEYDTDRLETIREFILSKHKDLDTTLKNNSNINLDDLIMAYIKIDNGFDVMEVVKDYGMTLKRYNSFKKQFLSSDDLTNEAIEAHKYKLTEEWRKQKLAEAEQSIMKLYNDQVELYKEKYPDVNIPKINENITKAIAEMKMGTSPSKAYSKFKVTSVDALSVLRFINEDPDDGLTESVNNKSWIQDVIMTILKSS